MCKKICALLLGCLLSVLLLMPAYAQDTEKDRIALQEKIEAEYQKDGAELQALMGLLADEDRYAVAEAGGNAEKTDTLISEYNAGAARKVYFSETLMLTVFEEKQTINAVFSEKYRWLVPINGNENQVAVFGVKDGVPRFSGISPMNGHYISDEILLQSLSESNIDPNAITSVKYLHAAMYHTTFAVIYTDSEVYAVPFSSNPDFSELEDKKVYIADDMMQFLVDTYDEAKLLENPDANGGVPLRNPKIEESVLLSGLKPLLISAVLLISFIVMCVSVYLLRKAGKTRKLQKP